MSKKVKNQEKFKTMIGGQALIEGIMMRGPKLDAIVTRNQDGIHVETNSRKLHSKKSLKSWPIIRGAVNFLDAQVTGVKAIMRSADLSPEESQESTSKFDQWLEKKLGNETFQKYVLGTSVVLGLGLMVLLFYILPELICSLFAGLIQIDPFTDLVLELIKGVIRIIIFFLYMFLASRMKDIKRVFAYHGAEHKTIRCYEAGLPLTVENVRMQTRKHPRCGTSFLFVIMILSILIFSVASSVLLLVVPQLETLRESVRIAYNAIMIGFKLLLLPVVVAFGYELNRLVGRYDNWITRILTAPGMWFQNITTFEPDDEMIEVGIAALTAVLPENEGEDLW